jgi:phenylpyruvate tautomerase PptA (4-oxalocrotonate tautomerase family)
MQRGVLHGADAYCDRQFRYYDHHIKLRSCELPPSVRKYPRREKVMPYLHLDLPGRFPAAQKRELAVRLCRLYADVMQTQSWRPNVGIAELGEDNLFHLGADGLEPIVMVLVEFRAGRPSEYRLKLADGIVDACVEVLKVPRRWVLVEFTPHIGEEIYRDGKWVADWTPEEGAPAH